MLALALDSAPLTAQGQQGQWENLSGAQPAANSAQQGKASYEREKFTPPQRKDVQGGVARPDPCSCRKSPLVDFHISEQLGVAAWL